MTQYQPTGQHHVTAHRGGMILAFGILGLFVCFIFGILAWTMGSSDIKAMDGGSMDPSGRGLTQAGQILGIVGVALNLLSLTLMVLFFFGMLGVAAAGAAGAGAAGP